MMLRRRQRLGDDRGSELIELAIVLPLLLIMAAAIVDFGFMFQRYEVLTNAAREGARLGSLPGYTATDVQNRVADYLNVAGMSGAPVPAVTFSNVAIGGGGPTISMVNVTAFFPYNFLYIGPIAGMVGGTGWNSITLQATSSMRVEAPGAGS